MKQSRLVCAVCSDDPRWEHVAKHNDTEIVGFCGEYEYLNDSWPTDVYYKGTKYSSVDEAFERAKWDLPRVPSGEEYFNPLWVRPALRIKGSLIRSKFECNSDLRSRLIHTDDDHRLTASVCKDCISHANEGCKLSTQLSKVLINANWWGDTFWGVHVPKKGKPRGLNHSGKLLMGARAHFKYGTWEVVDQKRGIRG